MFGLWGNKKKNSRGRANDRLRVVLMHDRIGSSSLRMDELREELLAVIARHVDIDGRPEISITSQGRQSVLDINIPLRSH
ncbi:MAG: cell division topological specificity factor MinE [Methylocystaceae bacterium]